MHLIALVLLALAALVHCYIFWLESLSWDSDNTRRTFGIASVEESRTTRPLAFNQGFYNLFLALDVVLGLVLQATAHAALGRGLLWAGAGSMLAAALVLALSDRTKLRPASVQGVFPALGLLLLLLAG